MEQTTSTSTSINIGVISGQTTNWYQAHSLLRRKDGSFCVFALDDERTQVIIKAKDFAGVTPRCEDFVFGRSYPDIRVLLASGATNEAN